MRRHAWKPRSRGAVRIGIPPSYHVAPNGRRARHNANDQDRLWHFYDIRQQIKDDCFRPNSGSSEALNFDL